ncbi:MAG: translation elongation factor Ts [Gammaproteobacteria bacterium RIFCSPHIGHO2_12_FULL_37_14]|nr:MAG: translation elongation factor Ts [Gammaproteobacteria bacterium RIFCSPHIGHO2_12_FULL_37_14]
MTVNISATLVKELRERTGAGMMECKKALEVTRGDIELAIEELRKSGRAKADKKAGRIAAEGAIVIVEEGGQAAMLEINSETDFVARDNNFLSFIDALAKTALATKVQDVAGLSATTLLGSQQSVEEVRQTLIAKVGENIQIRRLIVSRPTAICIGTYLHGHRIGVLVELDVDNKELARDIAMHIAASKPLVVSPENVPAEVIAKEREIYLAQAATSGKPQEIIEKMVAGRLKKYLDEVSLIGQPFVKDPDITVGGLLNKHRAKVVAFARYEVGEGIEKTAEDFREAVMSQMQGS